MNASIKNNDIDSTNFENDDSDKIKNNQKNVDPNEIKKFEDLAHRWWDRESEFKPLHDINPLRLNYIDQHSGGLKVLIWGKHRYLLLNYMP